MTGSIIDVTETNFDVEVLESETPVIVDFWAPWCGPCRVVSPILEELNSERDDLRVVKINVDENQALSAQFGIQSIPSVFAFAGGRPIDGFMGALPESQVKSFIERLVGPLGPGAAEELLKQADAKAAAGDAVGASDLYSAVLA